MMTCRLQLLVLTLVIFCIWNVKAANKVAPRIVGGRPTTVSEREYLVNLRKSRKFFCGGSLVAPKYVVTAAHCVKGVDRRTLTVHGGDTYLSRSGVVREVEKIFIPQIFTLKNLAMDVSVLRLNSAMTGSNIKPIALCSRSLSAGKRVLVSGWGLQNENARTPPNQVRTVQLKLMKKSNCARSYRGKIAMRNSMMCASTPGKDSCTGDSGGPLVFKNELCGIVSFGLGCGRTAYPGVYTSVPAVKSFIIKSMNSA